MSAALAGFGYHTELIDGREIEKPLPKNLHAFVQTFLIGLFYGHFRRGIALPQNSIFSAARID